MSHLVTCASQPTQDLSEHVPTAAFAEGVRARYLPDVGIVETTTVREGGVDIWEQENASSEADAIDWVMFRADYSEWEGSQPR